SQAGGITIGEHNIELMTYFSPFALKEDRVYLNANVGLIGKTQKIEGIPVPSFQPKGFNFGVVGEGELEVFVTHYLSLFGRAGARFCFIDTRQRIEGVYLGGLRINSAVFKRR
ncbi:MAG: hypothetical protein ACRCSB_05330, partial [Bacteroidales bacterium]